MTLVNLLLQEVKVEIFFIYFLIYSFIGFLLETIYVYLMDGELKERGFLFGPIIPLYGFGAMAIISFLSSYHNQIFELFIYGFLLTSILEYITSYVMEKMFDMRWWDYSERKFNIHGRVCLRNSFMFGFLSVILIQWVHPLISNLVTSINPQSLSILARLTFLITMTDWTLSMTEALNFKKYIVEIDELRARVQKMLSEKNIKITFKDFIQERDDFFVNLDSSYKELQETIKQRNERFRNREKRLLKRFPGITSKRFDKIIESIKEYNNKE